MAVLEVLTGQKHQSFLSSKISCAESLRRKPKISQKPEQGESLIFIRLAFLYILIELGFEAYAERNIKLLENLVQRVELHPGIRLCIWVTVIKSF